MVWCWKGRDGEEGGKLQGEPEEGWGESSGEGKGLGSFDELGRCYEPLALFFADAFVEQQGSQRLDSRI